MNEIPQGVDVNKKLNKQKGHFDPSQICYPSHLIDNAIRYIVRIILAELKEQKEQEDE